MNGYIIASALLLSAWEVLIITKVWPHMDTAHSKLGAAVMVVVPVITFALGLLC